MSQDMWSPLCEEQTEIEVVVAIADLKAHSCVSVYSHKEHLLLVGYIKIKLCKINNLFPYGLEVWHQCFLAGFREIHSTPFSNTKSVFEDLNILLIILLIFFSFLPKKGCIFAHRQDFLSKKNDFLKQANGMLRGVKVILFHKGQGSWERDLIVIKEQFPTTVTSCDLTVDTYEMSRAYQC